jgi:hypothetical protein
VLSIYHSVNVPGKQAVDTWTALRLYNSATQWNPSILKPYLSCEGLETTGYYSSLNNINVADQGNNIGGACITYRQNKC